MTIIKTSELTGAALDWAVAKCENHDVVILISGFIYFNDSPRYTRRFNPSSNWAQGGPIVEREGILLRAIRKTGHAMNGQWLAMYDGTNTGSMVHWVKREDWHKRYLSGATPLIAAMRCYCCAILGDSIDIPEELCQQ